MSALSCSFCGRISTKMEDWRQIFDRSMTEHDDENQYMMCPLCYKKIIADNVGAVIDPEREFDAIRDSLDEEDPVRNYIGMKLREFLSSNMYLKTQNIYFRDRDDEDLKEFIPFLDARILSIDKPDAQERIKVTLDCIAKED